VPITSYSDRLEDVMLYRVLRDVCVGFYVDVGANHPQSLSVTKLFYDLGWSGINVEPCPSWFAQLEKARPRDVNLRVAAGADNGEVEFHEILDSGLSTVVERFARRHQADGFQRRTYMVERRTLADICAEHVKGEIHFLKIDVEGAEHAVLQGCDFGRHRPWVVVVEATEPLTDIPCYAEWEPLLLGFNYEFATTDGLNRFYVAGEHAELRPLFSVAVDDYERAAWMEARRELEAIKASYAWRLLRRFLGHSLGDRRR
jgi:FkbM family methyltransferase